jgi:hypothetical protein
VMEDELPLQFVEFDMLAVEFGGDVRLPVFRNVGKFLGNVYLFHGAPSEIYFLLYAQSCMDARFAGWLHNGNFRERRVVHNICSGTDNEV